MRKAASARRGGASAPGRVLHAGLQPALGDGKEPGRFARGKGLVKAEHAAVAAVACGADGLMIEVHNNPACALSDGPQSLNFEKFARLSKELDPFWKLAGRN